MTPVTDGASYVVARDGTRLYVRHSISRPSAPALLLLHGSGDGSFVWGDADEVLREFGNIVAVDLRGHGDSDPSKSGGYGIEEHVSDVLGVMRALTLRRVILIGHSLGAQISIEVAASRHSPDILACVLVDICPEPSSDGMEQVALQLRQSLRVFTSVEEHQTFLRLSRPLLSVQTAAMISHGSLKACTGGFQPKLDPATLASRESTDPGRGRRYRDLLRQMRCPTLVIRGAGSAMVSPFAARETAVLCRGQLLTIPGAGHAVMNDNPLAFATAVATFLSALPGSSRFR